MEWIADIILKIIGWKVILIGEINKKSVVVVAPHTSYWDGFIGYLTLKCLGFKYKCIAAAWLFFWPMKYIMKYFIHGIPVGEGISSIRNAVQEFRTCDEMNLVICPEGQLNPTRKWNTGALKIAKLAKVPINMVDIDYLRKTVWVGIDSISVDEVRGMSDQEFLNHLRDVYSKSYYNRSAKYPEKFCLPYEYEYEKHNVE